MGCLLPRSMRSAALTLLVAVAVVPASAQAQTTPPAALALSHQTPPLARQVWPGDFNGDGIVDLIANAAAENQPPQLVFARGWTPGTFHEPTLLGIGAEPLGVADINDDGRLDVLVRTPTRYAIVPGNGNGTFGNPRPVASAGAALFSFAVTFDANGDGHLDLAISVDDAAGQSSVGVYPGHGDFTFGPPTFLSMTDPDAAATDDFNGDDRPDLAVTTVCCSVTVFTNQGGLLFSASEIGMSADLGDIATGDLNGDGRPDMVITQTFPGMPAPGSVALLLGNGNGTFQPKREFEAGVNGEYSVVVGDFTRDGIPDIATGNLSAHRDDDLGRQLWDSVTVFAGNGAGGLVEPVTVALDRTFQESEYRFTQHQLVAADVDDDGHLDLISSPAALLLNRPASPNDTPSVFAGPDRTYSPEDPFILEGRGLDRHWLYYEWTDELGQRVGPRAPRIAPVGLISGKPPGTYTYTLTVTDAHGGTASDSVVITVPDSDRGWTSISAPHGGERVPGAEPYIIRWGAAAGNTITRFDVAVSYVGMSEFEPIAGCQGLSGAARECVWTPTDANSDDAHVRVIATYDGGTRQWVAISNRFIVEYERPLGSSWTSQDIGAVGAEGEAWFEWDAEFFVRGAGADVWGTADAFHFLSQQVTGDFEIYGLVGAHDHVDDWTKVGFMMRESAAPNARHAFVLVTPSANKGIAFQRRPATGGTSVHTPGPAIGGQTALRLVRTGDEVAAYYSTTGENGPWMHIGTQTFTGLPETMMVGMATSSHVRGVVALGSFGYVHIVPISSWRSDDIGVVGAAGSAIIDDDRVLVSGAGADIWGTRDAFHYRSYAVTGDFDVETFVQSIEHVHDWTKAGLMMRDGLDADARHAFILATPSATKGIAFQRRVIRGGTSIHTAGPAVNPGAFLRLVRTGDVITAYYRADISTAWTTVGSQTFSELPATVRVGYAVSSHVQGRLAFVVFSQSERRSWEADDVGDVGTSGGSTTEDGGRIVVSGAGADVWGSADAFHFYSRQAVGDFDVSTLVESVEHVHDWTKAGLMLREGTGPAARHAFLMATPGTTKGVAFQRRTATGGASVHTAGPAVAPAVWLRLVRAGDVVTAHYRLVGTEAWTAIGSETFASLGDRVRVGVAVSSHVRGELATATFTNTQLVTD